jgi:hypothetical protein
LLQQGFGFLAYDAIAGSDHERAATNDDVAEDMTEGISSSSPFRVRASKTLLGWRSPRLHIGEIALTVALVSPARATYCTSMMEYVPCS